MRESGEFLDEEEKRKSSIEEFWLNPSLLREPCYYGDTEADVDDDTT